MHQPSRTDFPLQRSQILRAPRSILPRRDLRLRPLSVTRPTLVVDRALDSKSVQGEPDGGLSKPTSHDRVSKGRDERRGRGKSSTTREKAETHSSHSRPARSDDMLVSSKNSISVLPKDLVQLVLQLKAPPKDEERKKSASFVRLSLPRSHSPPNPPTTSHPSTTPRTANSSIQGCDPKAIQA